MRYELYKKEDYNEVVKSYTKVLQLEKVRDESEELRAVDKEVFEIQLMDVKNINAILKSYLLFAKCLIMYL